MVATTECFFTQASPWTCCTLHREEESPAILAEWTANNAAAAARGVFGAPTFFRNQAPAGEPVQTPEPQP